MNDPSDAELVRRCRAGDKAAFSVLVARHEPHLRRLLYSVVRFRPDVEDIMQEALLQAYLGLHSLRDATRFRPAEATAIVARLQSTPFLRPILPDLMASLLTLGSLHVQRAAVSRLHEQVFYGTLWVNVGGEVIEVDCRPSDALSLAIRLDTPMFVAEGVMAEAAVTPDSTGRYPVGRDADDLDGWYSLLQAP